MSKQKGIQSMFDICVMENEQVIGHITPEQLRRSQKSSSREFLSDTVEKFNAIRKKRGELTRVKLVFKKG
jgi:hypothetical protein